MTRQYKFRAFFKEDDGDLGMYYNVSPHGEYLAVTFNNDGKYDICDIDDFHVMEYTGLNDVEGKEIYEWDVVEMKPNVYADPQHYMVYRHYGGEYRLETPAHGCPLWLRRDKVKVVGNVFENPELMDKHFVAIRIKDVERWYE
ncbi:TPA: YopX family protein [Streptococcus suis]